MFKLANESNVPWKWWEYVTKFGETCKMSENQYNEECAERVRARSARQPAGRAFSASVFCTTFQSPVHLAVQRMQTKAVS